MNKPLFFILFFALNWANIGIAKTNTEQKVNQKPFCMYIGGFSGWGYTDSSIEQKATAFLSIASGGPLSVNATGDSSASHFWFGGGHVGYAFRKNNTESWDLTPAIELEGYYFANTLKVNVENDSIRLDLHDFSDTFPMKTGIILVNGSLAFTNNYITPYLGAGLGAGMVSIHGADSEQINPPEPGINHFNSDPNDFEWAFAVQAKGGLSHIFMPKDSFNIQIFSEYRFLYLSSTTYTFGSTQYPGHAATTNWDVTFSKRYYNLFSLGLDFQF